VRCNRSLVRALALAAVLLGPRLAGAFVDSAQFMDQSPDNPHAATTSASSEGVYPTGAPRVAGQTCAACHTDGPGVVQLKLGADPASLFTDGYEPGQTYTFELELLGELEGTDFNLPATCTEVPTGHDNFNYVQCDNNNFGLEIDSAAGPLTGLCAVAPVNGVCPPPSPSDESLVAPGGDAVFGNRAHGAGKIVLRNDPTRWHFFWTAPQVGTGPVTVYSSIVDGNGGAGDVSNDQDPYGDDVISAAITIGEKGGLAPPDATAGCGVARGPVPLSAVVLLTAMALVMRRRSRR